MIAADRFSTRSIKTQAAVVSESGGTFVLRDVNLSGPQADEVIVKLEASGMCHADLVARAGILPFPLPAVLGHEGVGYIVETGSAVSDVAVGDRMLISFSWCGHCSSCLRAAPVYCRNWFKLNMVDGCRADGSAPLTDPGYKLHGHFFGQSSFWRFIVTTARATVKDPEDIPAAILAPLGCGVQTGVSAVTNVLQPSPSARVAVFGVGAVGMSAVMGLRLTGTSQIIAVDIHPARLALAQALGATDFIDATSGNVAKRIAHMTRDTGLDGAIETSGNTGALRTAIGALAPAGTCVVIGVPGPGLFVDVNVMQLVGRGLRLVGTNRGGAVPRAFIPQLVELYRRGRLPVDKIVTSFNFTEINQAAEASLNGSVIKSVLLM